MMLMSLGLRMVQSQSLQQTLELTMEQKIKQVQSCLQLCRQTMEALREGVGLDRQTLGNAVFDAVVILTDERLNDPHVREATRQLLTSQENRKYLIDHAGNVADVMERSFFDFAGEAIIDGLDTDSDGRLYVPGDQIAKNVTRGRAIAALVDPDSFQEAIESNVRLAQELKQKGEDVEGLVRDISEGNAALEVANYVRSYQNTLSSLLALSFRISDNDGRPILRDFFRELNVVHKLDFEISERIVKRFVARFKSLNLSSAGYQYEDAMMNTIGEFAMVSLGILDPELFVRQRGEVKEIDVLFTDQNVDEGSGGKQSVVQTMDKIGLKQKGAIYWCRWAIPGVRLSAQTDGEVRKLLRDVIGKDKTSVLQEFGFAKFLEELRQIKREYSVGDSQAMFASALEERLTNSEFRDFLIDRCVRSWYPELKKFLKATRER